MKKIFEQPNFEVVRIHSNIVTTSLPTETETTDEWGHAAERRFDDWDAGY